MIMLEKDLSHKNNNKDLIVIIHSNNNNLELNSNNLKI